MPFVADEFTGKRFGKYEVLCRIAVGGMAEIFLGFPLAGPFAFRPVVLKRILSDHREDHNSLQMLIDEAKLTAQLTHPHIAQVLDLEVAGEDVILIIELIQGATIEELVDLSNKRAEPLPLGFVIAAIRDMAMGLQHAHTHKDSKGTLVPIIHRDVTPRNLMVTFQGVGKVLDFGIARAMGASRRTVAGMVRGTAAYMSPEQAIDAKVDTRSDIFSLGTIFHELLTGQRLFSRGNPGKEMAAVYEAEIPLPSVVNKRVPKALDAVVLRALERSVSRRYQTPAELMKDLATAASTLAWTTERNGELVRERFVTRQGQLAALLRMIPEDGASNASTDVAREQLRTAVVTKPSTDADDGAMTKAMPRPGTGRKELKTDEDPSQVRTRFFTPQFPGIPPGGPGETAPDLTTDEGPVPQDVSIPPPTIITSPGLAPTGSGQVPPQLSARRHLTHDTATQRSTSSAGLTVMLAIGAVLALVLGAAGGVLVYRSVSGNARPQSVGMGRLSITTDRPAEVRIGSLTAPTPVNDVFLPVGRHSIELRELATNAPWRRLDVEVLTDRPTRREVKLDTLPALP